MLQAHTLLDQQLTTSLWKKLHPGFMPDTSNDKKRISSPSIFLYCSFHIAQYEHVHPPPFFFPEGAKLLVLLKVGGKKCCLYYLHTFHFYILPRFMLMYHLVSLFTHMFSCCVLCSPQVLLITSYPWFSFHVNCKLKCAYEPYWSLVFVFIL